MGKSKKEDSFIKQSENPTSIEKAGLKVVTNYESLIQNYQTALNSLVSAARDVDTVIFQYAEALNKFSKSMKLVLRACSDTAGTDETIDNAVSDMSDLHKNIQGEYADFSQVYAADVIKPFEDKLFQDTQYLEEQLRTFKTKFGENFKVLQEREEKLDKMNKNRGKNKKEDKKRMELETEISQRKDALETYTKDKLKKSITEQRQRYAFLTKKHTAHINKLKLLYDQCGGHVSSCQSSLTNSIDTTVETESEIEKYFPQKRKSVYHATREESPDRVVSPQANSIYTLTPSDTSEEFIPPKPVAPAPSNTKNKKMVKATHGFHGGDHTQLKMEPGDYIQLLIPQPRDGWHYGENDRTGLKGWFPIKYTIKV